MYNQRRQNSAVGTRRAPSSGQQRPPSVETGSKTYLNPTNSSTGHSKGGLAKRPPATSNNTNVNNGKPPRASDLAALSGGAANPTNGSPNDASSTYGNTSEYPRDTANNDNQRPPSNSGGYSPGSQFNASQQQLGSVARSVYRPSAILIDKITHGQAPPLAPIDSISPTRASNGRPPTGGPSNPFGGDGQYHGNFRPSSNVYGDHQNMSAGGAGGFNASHGGNPNNSSMLSTVSTAKDLLRYKESLKTQSPSALALEATRQQLQADLERERLAKLEFREQWRQSVEGQLRAKEQRRQEEKERGKQERTVIEDRFLEEKNVTLTKKRQMAAEIQRQKHEDEMRAQQKAMEAVERAREERAQMDLTVRQMHEEKVQAHRQKVLTQHELLSHANQLQRQRIEERTQTEAERKAMERQLANAAKEAEVRELMETRKLQKQRQKEVLEASKTLSTIKQLNDTRAQLEYESALEAQKRMQEDREAREKREQLEAKAHLAKQLKQQMLDRQEARTVERKRSIEQQRTAADEERRAAERERELEKQMKHVKQMQLQQELEGQMTNNMNKTLVELVHN